ncbi:MAG: hypothetical protein ABFC88_13160 [Thermoguttaceae bacterium]
MNKAKLDVFMATYIPCLREAVTFHPDDYCYRVEDVPRVANLMRAAIEDGTYSHDGRAMRMTCRILGINHSRKAIAEFLQ